jgi:hypothetical protein
MTVRGIAWRAVVGGLLGFAAAPALADAIDGDWCSAPDVKHMSIAGPNITTPDGTRTTGNYSRHAFSYVVPQGDTGAGSVVLMRLLNEEQVQVTVGNGTPEIWRRCELNV